MSTPYDLLQFSPRLDGQMDEHTSEDVATGRVRIRSRDSARYVSMVQSCSDFRKNKRIFHKHTSHANMPKKSQEPNFYEEVHEPIQMKMKKGYRKVHEDAR